MFGPNNIPEFHHRSLDFRSLYKNTVETFKKKFDLEQDNIVLFITGSGTLANEIVISSLLQNIDVITTGTFSERLVATSKHHKKNNKNTIRSGVMYETSVSKLNCTKDLEFVDCVSSFPYYKPPKNAVVWTTVSSKQLISATGLSIIVLKNKSVLDLFKKSEHTYLSLYNYYEYGEKLQTPNTTAISALQDLNYNLHEIDFYKRTDIINRRYEKLYNLFDSLGIGVIGERPVISIPKNIIPNNIITKYGVYTNGINDQIFTWSGKDEMYDEFIKDMKN